MIILDTNVISEIWKPEPDSKVRYWLNEQIIETLYLTTITVAELRSGISLMPEGKRKTKYRGRLENELLPTFKGRILVFDLPSTKCYADLIVRSRVAGLPVGVADGYIAAIALFNKFIVASRDVSPYKAAGLKTINPWEN